jgi:hypothetical protein
MQIFDILGGVLYAELVGAEAVAAHPARPDY